MWLKIWVYWWEDLAFFGVGVITGEGEYIPVALKRLVFDRAKGNCEYCRSQSRFAIDPLIIEHIKPVSRGGKTAEDNLALVCQTCNNYKHTKTEAVDPVTN